MKEPNQPIVILLSFWVWIGIFTQKKKKQRVWVGIVKLTPFIYPSKNLNQQINFGVDLNIRNYLWRDYFQETINFIYLFLLTSVNVIDNKEN